MENKENKRVEKVMFTFYIETKTAKEFRDYCKNQCYNQSRLVEKMLREFLDIKKMEPKQ